MKEKDDCLEKMKQKNADLKADIDGLKQQAEGISSVKQGSCQCRELTEQVHKLQLINAQQNNRIGNLKLQIRTEEFPYQQKVNQLEECTSFYKSKNKELRRDLLHLHTIIEDSGCDCDGNKTCSC